MGQSQTGARLRRLRFDVAVISQDGGIPEDRLKFLIEQAKRDVKMAREIPLSEIADFGVLREIQKELGVR